ncbi:hypothetical protein [Sphingobacterium thalpophilum]|uniref:hypothetical protein n=1 Tax=Sphingobacterium thalpophilum TaxID=259 RepID=UPI0024A66AA9|nr:hypothetical protein [Sphingobacterium thalpophilum]
MNPLSAIIELQQQQIDKQIDQISALKTIIIVLAIIGCGLLLFILFLLAVIHGRTKLNDEI